MISKLGCESCSDSLPLVKILRMYRNSVTMRDHSSSRAVYHRLQPCKKNMEKYNPTKVPPSLADVILLRYLHKHPSQDCNTGQKHSTAKLIYHHRPPDRCLLPSSYFFIVHIDVFIYAQISASFLSFENMEQMRAAVISESGGPEVFRIRYVDKPRPKPGFVLIRVRAFGINRSEIIARRTYNPTVRTGCILGVEAVGEVEEAPAGEFSKGSIVATAMGSLESEVYGTYAEFTCVYAKHVQRLKPMLTWSMLGAMPQIYQAAWGSLFQGLHMKPGETLLIRGGTTSVGLAAAAIATCHGVNVTATTRNIEHGNTLVRAGATRWILDSGLIAPYVAMNFPGEFDKVLDLIGTSTLMDSIYCAKVGGIVCHAGSVGDEYGVRQLKPMEHIPDTVSLTSYCGDANGFVRTPLQILVENVASGKLPLIIAKSFSLDQIADAHRYMEQNHGDGKVVITVPHG